MIGLITTWKNQTYRLQGPVAFNLTQEIFGFQGDYLCIWRKSELDLKFKLTVTSFDGPIMDVRTVDIEPEYNNMIESEEWQLQSDISEFRALEAILKEENLIE